MLSPLGAGLPSAVEALLQAIAHPVALAREGRVVSESSAVRALLGESALGRGVAELSLPPGVVLREEPLASGTTLCSFVQRGVTLESALSQLGAEEASRLLISHRHDAVSVTDTATGRFVDVSDAWCRQYGYSREEAAGRMGPADVSAELDATRTAIAKRVIERAVAAPELRWHRRRDGGVFPVEVQCGSLHVGGRDLVYARLLDVTERVRAEEALRRSERNHRALIEELPYAVLVHREGQLLYGNAEARRLLRCPEGGPIEGALLDRVHPEDREALRESEGGSREVRLLDGDGGVVTVELSSMRTLFDGGAATLILAQDVSTRRAMEARLVASDRLASLGRLAASVGHDINNPLTYVLGSLELIRADVDRLELDAEARRSLEERLGAVEQGVLRVRDVVRDLRALARADDPEGPAELCRTLDGCAQMAGHELRHRARVVRDQPPGPIWIAASEGRLAQVFLNLLINAAQSIPEGSVAENEIRLEVRLEGNEAVVSVADTGMGLDPALEARIFEPFFTTKQGSGMGLGLAICRHVVGSLGGRIEVERRAPRGTVFRVHLPRADPPARAERSARDAPLATAARRVLVVDDEPRVRAMLAEWLDGHDVETAASGREAIARFEQGPAVDVVVCDLMMGDLTGMDVHAHLVGAGFPAERFVFVTGGEYTERARAFVEQEAAEPLIKPFTREALLAAVARASARSRG